MKRKMAALLLVVLAMAGSANALETRELIAVAAMPLAVAAVADISGVPTSDLVTVVSAMNRAYVPAPQFVEIVRYTPVALVDDRYDPPFVTYVQTQADRGLWGDAYALSLSDRLRMYGVREVNVVRPVAYTPSYVVQRQYVPSYVVTRVEQRGVVDPMALIAMPLAVAAVSELAGLPQSDFLGLVSALNQAYVPAPQFVEIVRYSPVVLVDRDPTFVRFVRTEVDRGVVGTRLVRVIDDRFRTVGFRDVDFFDPMPARVIVERQEFVPPRVVTHVARVHPHGGPPGQIKKDLGVQTGAEVVHGDHPARTRVRVTGRTPDRDDDRDRGRVASPPTRQERIILPSARDKDDRKEPPRATPDRSGASHGPAMKGRDSSKGGAGAKSSSKGASSSKGKGKKKD